MAYERYVSFSLPHFPKKQLTFVGCVSLTALHKLARRLQLRQLIASTASVYLRRFYLKNSYAETDACIVIAACVYVAAKVEESPVHIKSVVTESRIVFGGKEKHS